MDLNDGQPLLEVLRRTKRGEPFPVEFRLHVICEALRALHAAHERYRKDASAAVAEAHGVSLKSVVVGYDGRVTVDFGTSRDSVDRISTTDGVFHGKFGYAAPEQARGLPGDRRADVFAAGVLLWEVIAVRRFTAKERTRAAVEARISGFEPRIQAVVPEVDPALAAICDRAMHVNPEMRYASADELRLALTAYIQGRFPPVRVRLVGEAMRAMFIREHAAVRPVVNENDEATTVGDLSVLIQSTAATNSAPPPPLDSAPPLAEPAPSPWMAEEPADEPPNRRPLVIALAATVVAVGTFFLSMSRQPPEAVEPPTPAAGGPERAGLVSPAVATATATAPTPEPAPAPSAEPSAAVESPEPAAAASEKPPKPASGRTKASSAKPQAKAPAPKSAQRIDEDDPFK